mmetsp:Transcript_10945/g.16839  ORF Transcript_10945/g.16839 Transcript_10945/m.16839 type:complete len:159 (-) Transcript_10945:208-684(-)
MDFFFPKALPRLAVPSGKTRICVAGFGVSHHTGRARKIADTIAKVYPDKYETWYFFSTIGFRPDFLNSVKESLSQEDQKKLESHKTSPFCWLELSDGTKTGIGGRDRLCEWVQANFDVSDEKNEPFVSLTKNEPTVTEVFFDAIKPGTAKTSEDTSEE